MNSSMFRPDRTEAQQLEISNAIRWQGTLATLAKTNRHLVGTGIVVTPGEFLRVFRYWQPDLGVPMLVSGDVLRHQQGPQPCRSCGEIKSMAAKGLCKSCYAHKEVRKQFPKLHLEQLECGTECLNCTAGKADRKYHGLCRRCYDTPAIRAEFKRKRREKRRGRESETTAG